MICLKPAVFLHCFETLVMHFDLTPQKSFVKQTITVISKIYIV
jgi:hypothetical protein